MTLAVDDATATVTHSGVESRNILTVVTPVDKLATHDLYLAAKSISEQGTGTLSIHWLVVSALPLDELPRPVDWGLLSEISRASFTKLIIPEPGRRVTRGQLARAGLLESDGAFLAFMSPETKFLPGHFSRVVRGMSATGVEFGLSSHMFHWAGSTYLVCPFGSSERKLNLAEIQDVSLTCASLADLHRRCLNPETAVYTRTGIPMADFDTEVMFTASALLSANTEQPGFWEPVPGAFTDEATRFAVEQTLLSNNPEEKVAIRNLLLSDG